MINSHLEPQCISLSQLARLCFSPESHSRLRLIEFIDAYLKLPLLHSTSIPLSIVGGNCKGRSGTWKCKNAIN